jgi:hypothetical protein
LNVNYSSKSLFVYEQDFPNGLAPGTTAQATFNTHGDSDFFWEKFAAFGLVTGSATTRSLDQLPAVTMSVTNQTTGRVYSNVPIALPNFAWYGDFMPQMVVWPKKSSILVELDNIDPGTTISVPPTGGYFGAPPGTGLSSSSQGFFGYAANVFGVGHVIGGPTTPTPPVVDSETLLAVGYCPDTGSVNGFVYLIMSAGAQNLFASFSTINNSGTNTYQASAALYLPEGQSGSLGSLNMTASGGNLWAWPSDGGDFNSDAATEISFASFTNYSLLQLSFIGTKAFP